MTVTVEYDSNNSGGSWWLSDQHWRDLEAAGWQVEWFAEQDREWCRADKDGRWLGALASKAFRVVENPQDAVSEWERITGMSAYDQGCNCCGRPHSFSFTDAEGGYHYMDVEYGPVSHGWS